ncbi:ATP-binding cassette sub-family A member 3-like isoform X3 [Pomacea canaliculata]|uniref:ATP-binding cassette sub-family A member 3-like isoform X3 n=1 Tax=Pomacea canaliculata TaxID=400727 RepID=UPI000D729CE2|nr:ATP-binding cassette sub-family A member 3-like isoform X3 [Pomacea canaliculata]
MDDENTESLGLLSQVKLLLWKNFLLLTRRPCLTIAEIILPMLGAVIMNLFREVVTPVNHENPLTWPPMPITLSFGDLAFSATVLYAPNTSLVNSLMEDINETFAKDSLEDISTGFVYLQHLIGMSIIKKWKPDPVLNVSYWLINRMPFPPYKEDKMAMLIDIVYPNLMLIFILISVVTMVREVVLEKEEKLKEFMKVMGVTETAIWMAWFLQFFLYLMVASVADVIFLCVGVGVETPALPYSSPSLILVFFMCYSVCVILFSFFISTLVSQANIGAAIAGLVFFLTFLPASLADTSDPTMTNQKLALCLFFNTAMALGLKVISYHESTGLGMKWSNVAEATGFHSILLMLLLDTLIFAVLAWYISNVHPGEYGVARPWYFPCQRSYWCGEETEPSSPEELSDTGDPTYFESEPPGLTVGVQVLHLRKVFSGPFVAVKDVSLTMFEGHITVLLGHNGAGKTTTMSMLTGFIPPTSGTAYVNGYDIRTNFVSARRYLGLCPQYNILFKSLTIEEHLKFFALLKGCREKDVPSIVIRSAEEVGLNSRLKDYADKLSGGQMRKLCIAIALIGGSKVVILDEPSSGMDPSARRQMWEVLQRNREGRTMLLTTHYMDEADALGDRIAIMAKGVVKCCGTTMFLRSIYGAGYHLIIVKNPGCVTEAVTSAIQGQIENAELEGQAGAELTYLLPKDQSSKFVQLFSMIEYKSGSLGISSFGVTATTMEEIFLKVGIDETPRRSTLKSVTESETSIDSSEIISSDISSDISSEEDERDTSYVALERSYKRLTYPHLQLSRFYGMFVKKAITSQRHPKMTLAQMVLPILLVVLVLRSKGEDESELQPSLRLNLDVFTKTTVVYSSGHPPSTHTTNLGNSYSSLFDKDKTLKKADKNITLYFLDQAKELEREGYVKQLIIGGEFRPVEKSEEVEITAWYSGQQFHALPISVAHVINAFARVVTGDKSRTINTFNHPLPPTDEAKEKGDLLGAIASGFILAFTMLFGMSFLTAAAAYFPIAERQTSAKHVQIVSGVDPFSFWLSAFTWDYIVILIVNLFLLITIVAYQVDTFKEGSNLAVLWLVMMTYGLAVLPYSYILHFLFLVPTTGFVVLLNITFMTGLVTISMSFLFHIPGMDIPGSDTMENIFRILFPHFCFGFSILSMYVNKFTLNLCKNVNVTTCPETQSPCCKDHCQKTCFPHEENYLALSYPAVGTNVVCMLVQGITFFALLLVLESQIPQKLGYCLKSSSAGVDAPSADEDFDVKNERLRVSSGEADGETLVLNNIYKQYGPVVVVNHVFLGVAEQECFGLLGQNGAGKSTTFKLITCDTMLTSGDIFVQKYSVKTDFRKVQSCLGYCPQVDSLIGHLTARETLYMFARLRGVPSASIPPLVKSLLSIVFLSEYADKMCGNYSGGNKRKLCTAAALIGNPPVVLLDEPSAGVDPAARRQLWTVLSGVRASGRTLVLTSHSMEETEALCTRLAIMVNGQFKCLGSPQHLKSKFAQGFLLKVKVDSESEDDSQNVIDYVLSTIPDTETLDEKDLYITFKVNNTNILVSELFSAMEQCKQMGHIEDYAIHQTTLEEIFLAFVSMQHPNREVKGGVCSCLCSCCP